MGEDGDSLKTKPCWLYRVGYMEDWKAKAAQVYGMGVEDAILRIRREIPGIQVLLEVALLRPGIEEIVD